MNINEVAMKVVDYLSSLPEGTEISTCEAVDKVIGCKYLPGGDYLVAEERISFKELFDIDSAVRKIAKKKGIYLDDSKYTDMAVGLPFHIPYIVKK